jgi:hypothetical protein
MRRLMLLALPFALLACGSDNNSPTSVTLASLAGVWNLQTANGAALPFTISNIGGTKIELLSITETVLATGAFSGAEVTRITMGTVVTVDTLPSAGTISLSGTLVTVNLTGSASASGTLISSTSFSFTDPNTLALFVFVKQ